MNFYFSTILRIDEFDGFHFLQDHIGTNYRGPWDDHDFITSFNAYYCQNGVKEHLGLVKILTKNYKDTSKYFRNNCTEVLEGKVFNITLALKSSAIVSLATSIEYYKRLRKLFSEPSITDYLEKIGDASYRYDDLEEVKTWPGFNESLLRDSSVSEAILRKGRHIASGRYVPDEEFSITVDLENPEFEPVQFSFLNKGELGRQNINILIGKNGTGKTFILRRLSEYITGATDGSEKWPYFHKLLVAAFSPFENFHTKNSLLDALDAKYSDRNPKANSSQKSAKRKRLHVNEYAYIGFRNDSDIFSLAWPKEHSARSLIKILEYDYSNRWWAEQKRFDILFDTLNLCLDFDEIGIRTQSGELLAINKQTKITQSLIKQFQEETNPAGGIHFNRSGNTLPLSSGQIIYSYLLPCLVAEIEDESLVIIDEPELYLHPTLEIGLINMLKTLLEATSSYAIIATHSAVMAREVERAGVTILSPSDGRTEAKKPTFETFGESLELIIGEAFDGYSTLKPYQSALDKALSRVNNMEEALTLMSSKIGDEALAYIISRFHEDNEINIED